MFCKSCRAAKPNDNGRFIVGTDNFRIDNIKGHGESPSHCSNQRSFDIKNCPPQSLLVASYTGEIKELCLSSEPSSGTSGKQGCALIGPMDAAIRRMNHDQAEQLRVCFQTAYFVAKEELPFTMYPSLLSLQQKHGVVIPNSYGTDQACRRFMKYIYDDIQEKTITLIKNARVLSVMFDGATDVSVSENEIVYARVVENGIPRNVFVQIGAVEHAHAEGVLSTINNAMDSIDPGWNWKLKLIATGSDGASVNLSKRHSVAKLLKDDVPHLLAMHCVSHRLELGAIDAMRERDGKLFADLKTVRMSLHKHYHYSAKAIRELQLLADAMDEKMVKPANLSGTRWMPHLSRCLNILLTKYTTFVTHFENTLEGRIGTADVQARARFILRHLKDFTLLRYMHFLTDILGILSDLPLQFQKDSCGIPDATAALETACLRLTALQHRPGASLQYFLYTVTDNFVFKNVQLKAPTLGAEQLKAKQDTLIDVVIDHLTHRIGDIDSDRLLRAMQIFFPVNLPETQAERAVYGEESLAALCLHFNDVLMRLGCNIQRLQEVEWPALKVLMSHQHRDRVQDFYYRLFTNPNQSENLQNILMLVEIIMSIPVSSAVCERGFSAMARVKSDWRARLDISMLNMLMALAIEGPTVEAYNAQRAIELWWHGGQRARRPDFDD